MLFEKLVPDIQAESIYNIDLNDLKQRGIDSIIIDLDNTLIKRTAINPTEKLTNWIKEVKEKDFKFLIISNNTKRRVGSFAKAVNVPYIHMAKKPFTKSFNIAMKKLDTTPSTTTIVGDQLFTDILGGNRFGLLTVLVKPVCIESDGLSTKVTRFFERRVYSYFKKRGRTLQ